MPDSAIFYTYADGLIKVNILSKFQINRFTRICMTAFHNILEKYHVSITTPSLLINLLKWTPRHCFGLLAKITLYEYYILSMFSEKDHHYAIEFIK